MGVDAAGRNRAATPRRGPHRSIATGKRGIHPLWRHAGSGPGRAIVDTEQRKGRDDDRSGRCLLEKTDEQGH